MTATVPPAVAPTAPDPEQFVGEVMRRRDERLQGLVRSYPRNQPIASDADPTSCLRRQVLEIVRWQDKAPIPADRQGRLLAGDDAEKRGLDELKAMGYRVVKEQVPFELQDRKTREPVLRGKIDGFLELAHHLEIPVEVKSLSPWVYDAINKPEDLFRFWWTAKHFYQMQSYLIGYSMPWGLIWITNLAGDWKPILIRLDYEVAEKLWSFAEAVAAGVRRARAVPSDLPPFTTDPLQCTRCPFFGRSCNPPIQEQGASVLDDPDFELALIRRAELWPAHIEYERLDKRAKDRLKLGPALQVCGEFVIEVSSAPRAGYVVKETTVRTVKIERAGQAPQDAQ